MEAKVPKVLLVGRHQNIEPLGLQHLAGVARNAGWERDVVLVKNGDFAEVIQRATDTRPDIVALSVWTGFHLQSFAAADELRKRGIVVAIGGPHPTYNAEACATHADFVSKGEGFGTFRRILSGEVDRGIIFDDKRMSEGYPYPDRALVYDAYPDLAASPIKSMMCSIGCPFTCAYCYAPAMNDLYGGFELNVRPVDDLIREGQEIRERWPSQLLYMQDDIFGHRLPWLEEFARRWPVEVGTPWHCQIRLEMTREERRLDLFKAGGCTGITLAIESGNDFLRRYVLQRAMADHLIVDGIRKIQARGFSLRTEQILAVPFSDLSTDLETLELNTRLNPEMAWTSILAPYGGTAMGTIASGIGFYDGNNDDLSETFFDESVLKHVFSGWRSIAPLVESSTQNSKDNPLLRMKVLMKANDGRSVVGVPGGSHCTIEFLSQQENKVYARQTVRLQQIFNWAAKIDRGDKLAGAFVRMAEQDRTWKALGYVAQAHLSLLGLADQMPGWIERLCAEMGVDHLPDPIAENPWYFVFLPGGGELATEWLAAGVFDAPDPFPQIGYRTRQWLFHTALYKLREVAQPIAHSGNGPLTGRTLEATE